MHTIRPLLCIASFGLLLLASACGGDDSHEADRLGVGAQCTTSDQCDSDTHQQCLAFKGGYCGIQGCTADADCPESSACVAHTDGMNYCFRTCVDKADCNANRDLENEANCSSSVTFVEDTAGRKACVPPSSN
jgi:hypothetical protein